MFVLAMNVRLVLREFIGIEPHTILLEVAPLLSHICVQVTRITLLDFRRIRIIKRLLLILHPYGHHCGVIGMDMRQYPP